MLGNGRERVKFQACGCSLKGTILNLKEQATFAFVRRSVFKSKSLISSSASVMLLFTEDDASLPSYDKQTSPGKTAPLLKAQSF